MINFDDLSLFVRIAELHSISAAARLLDLTPATASAAIKRVEKKLGCPLFVRSTRSLKLTTQGEVYLQYAQNALTALEKGEKALLDTDKNAIASLRLAAPSDLGRNYLPPLLEALQEQWPQLRIRLELSDRINDLQREAIDVALRYGSEHAPTQVVLPIAEIPRYVCASPSYLARYGEPKTPLDLQNHHCLLYDIGDLSYDRWVFDTAEGRVSINVSGHHTSNDAELVRRWCVAGYGITLKSGLDIAEDLRAQRIKALLLETPCPSLHLSLICAHRHHITPIVKELRIRLLAAVADALTDLKRTIGMLATP